MRFSAFHSAIFSLLGAVALCSPAAHAAGYTETRYPLVLVHGLFGFDNIGPVDYWYGVAPSLRSGGATVFTSQVSAANSTQVRGEQLLTEVKRIVAVSGKSKVNLIGHSHGGPTIRYVATVRPDLVASVTSIGGVNKGSAAADVLLGVAPPGSISRDIISKVADGLAKLISFLSGGAGLPQNSLAAAQSLSTAGSAKFNAAHPAGLPFSACGEGAYQVNGVSYFSWSGGQSYTNALDAIDPALALTGLVFGGAKNDGLVSSCSSHLGRVIRDDYAMNHMDEVNHSLGIVHLFETNPLSIFRSHANRLQNQGL
ncbi:triacylglycerol lipase [Massilia sp. W12]|uniref:lipase family alpha/beta hydrolase n=1 Tax=Massilia sp. W12 TaxID=3126507 RepID=UPI0030CCBD78